MGFSLVEGGWSGIGTVPRVVFQDLFLGAVSSFVNEQSGRQSEWLVEKATAGRRVGVFSLSRRLQALIGSVASVALLAAGIVVGAAPAQANGGPAGGTAKSGINNSFYVELTGLDATTVAALQADRGALTFDATLSGQAADIATSDLFIAFDGDDATSVGVWITTDSIADATKTMDSYTATIATDAGPVTIANSELTTVGPDNVDTEFVLSPDGRSYTSGRIIQWRALIPNDTTDTYAYIRAFDESTGRELAIFGPNSTTVRDGVVGPNLAWIGQVALAGSVPYGTVVRLVFSVGEEDSAAPFGFIPRESAVSSNTVTLVEPSGGGEDSGGGSSTPATPSTDTGSGSSASEFTVVPFEPVVFADPAVVTAAEIAALTPEQVASITAEQIRDLDPAAFAGFTAAQVRLMSTEQINAIRPARAAQLSIAAVTALSGGQLFNMRPASVAALKPEAIELLTAEQLASVRPEAFKKMDAEAINKIRPVQTVLLNAAQMRAFNQRQMNAMRVDTLADLSRPQARALRPKQIENMNDRQLLVFGETFGPTLRPRQEAAVEFQISIRPNPDFVAIRFE